MSTSACHLGYFFAILKTQVSEKLGPPLLQKYERLVHNSAKVVPLQVLGKFSLLLP